MNLSALADERHKRGGKLRVLCRQCSWVKQMHVIGVHESVVHEVFFVQMQIFVLLFQISGSIAADPVPENEVLCARGSSYWVCLNKSHRSQRFSKCRGRLQRALNCVATKIRGSNHGVFLPWQERARFCNPPDTGKVGAETVFCNWPGAPGSRQGVQVAPFRRLYRC
jgi:hypothetical protein